MKVANPSVALSPVDVDLARREKLGLLYPAAMTLVYVGGEEHIRVLSLEDGRFSLRQVVDVGTLPSFLCFAPSKKTAFAAIEGGDAVVSLRVVSDGTLEPISRSHCSGGPAYISVDRTESWLFSASYGSGELRVYPIAADGSLGEATQTDSAGRWAHAALIEPSNERIYVPCKGTDELVQFNFDAATGRMTRSATLATPRGSGPRHIAFSASGKRCYVMTELGCTLLVLDWIGDRFSIVQSLPTLPRPVGAADSGADVHVSEDGRFVYVSNRDVSQRGDDTLAVFATQGDGVRLVTHQNCSGSVPRNFCLLQNSLIAANQESRSLTLFDRDTRTGTLTLRATHLVGERVFWVGPAQAPGAP